MRGSGSGRMGSGAGEGDSGLVRNGGWPLRCFIVLDREDWFRCVLSLLVARRRGNPAPGVLGRGDRHFAVLLAMTGGRCHRIFTERGPRPAGVGSRRRSGRAMTGGALMPRRHSK
jgi:hypothetical protein